MALYVHVTCICVCMCMHICYSFSKLHTPKVGSGPLPQGWAQDYTTHTNIISVMQHHCLRHILKTWENMRWANEATAVLVPPYTNTRSTLCMWGKMYTLFGVLWYMCGCKNKKEMRHILNFPCSILVSITSLVVIHLVGSLLLCLKISTHMFRGRKGYLSLDLKVGPSESHANRGFFSVSYIVFLLTGPYDEVFAEVFPLGH